MPRKAKTEPSYSADQIRAAAEAFLDHFLAALSKPAKPAAKARQPKTPKPTKATGKRPGRPPMTPEQRAAAKATREVAARASEPAPRAKPQPVTRASVAAQQAHPAALGEPVRPSYFTKAN